MNPIKDGRAKVRVELEAPPALRRFGSGWISGVIGVVLGLASLGIVVSMRYPGIFSMEEFTVFQGKVWFRMIVFFMLITAFVFAMLSLILRETKTLGTLGMVVTLFASLLGGSTTSAALPDYTPLYLGLDFFVLNVLFTGLLFVPIERLFPKYEEQALFRKEWREDLFYYFVSSMAVQLITWLNFLPANTLLAITAWTDFRAWVAEIPLVVQVILIMVFSDLAQYWVHRAFHRIPWLWKFHAVHHSAKTMDWMAGARMHFLEILVIRGATVTPMLLLGFHETAVGIYIFLVYLWSTFIHANLGWNLGWMERVVVTPRFHHWHHGIEKDATDVNFAIHFPWLDSLFGTHHLPKGRWPNGYGIDGHPVPLGYWKQWMYPFRRRKD